MQDKWQELKRRLAQVANVERASALLGWDQETYMPPRGAVGRAEQLATLDKLAHELFTSDDIGELLEACADDASRLDYDSDDASLIRVTTRDYRKAKRVPPELVEELSRVSAIAFSAWEKSRAQSDFKQFQPHLERIVELEIQLAEHLGYKDRVYDALLDRYEPEMTTARVEGIFADLKRELMPLVRTIAKKVDRVDAAFLRREYGEQQQWDLGLHVIQRFGFDLTGGREDKSAHPFTTGLGLGDVRITTRVNRRFLSTALFGTLHECGHALYEQGYRANLELTPLAGAACLGAHESQSRLWENLVGRSRAFCQFLFPRLREVFPEQLADQNVESFYRAVNEVRPSLIRVEADEVTYNLHIMLRFEIENDLLERRLRVADVPEAWKAKMNDYLGVVPQDDASGSLQDDHWSLASFGYFPTYSLGNLFSVQLFDKAHQDIRELTEQIETGDFSGLLTWLRTHVHTHGRKFTLDELAQRATGESLNAQPYRSYLRRKFGEIYGF